MNAGSIVTKIFPKYTAAGAQVAAHGQDAWNAVSVARSATDTPSRLDAALHATNAFDHAVTSSQDLPLGRIMPGVGKYYVGYEAAKAAVTVIIATGIVPGAREHVGKADVVDSQAEFHKALDASVNTTRFGRYRTGDWMRDAQADAATGIGLLQRADLQKPLLGELSSAAQLMHDRKTVPSAAVASLDKLYASAQTAFETQIAAATNAAVNAPAASSSVPGDIGVAELPVQPAAG